MWTERWRRPNLRRRISSRNTANGAPSLAHICRRRAEILRLFPIGVWAQCAAAGSRAKVLFGDMTQSPVLSYFYETLVHFPPGRPLSRVKIVLLMFRSQRHPTGLSQLCFILRGSLTLVSFRPMVSAAVAIASPTLSFSSAAYVIHTCIRSFSSMSTTYPHTQSCGTRENVCVREAHIHSIPFPWQRA